MSFHEKSSWISLAAILSVSVVYFLYVLGPAAPVPGPSQVRALVACLAAFVLIEVVGHLAIALHSPAEARARRDERERLIDLEAIRLAAIVYVIGSFLALFTLHLGAGAVDIVNSVLLAFVVAEVVRHGARLTYHRIGS